jgi:hypothetical protein
VTRCFCLSGLTPCSALCYVLLPGSIGYGQVTPANYKLPYRTNGLTAYVITHVLFAVLCVIPSTRTYFGVANSNALADNWCCFPSQHSRNLVVLLKHSRRGGILVMANLYGYSLAIYRCCCHPPPSPPHPLLTPLSPAATSALSSTPHTPRSPASSSSARVLT